MSRSRIPIEGSVLPYAMSVNAETARRVPPLDVANPFGSAPDMGEAAASAQAAGSPGPASNPTAGLREYTSFEDWYYRIHILPSIFELGNLVGNQQRSVTLWNAYLTPITLEDFTVIGGEGIIVSEPVTPPTEIEPLKTLVYEFEITTDGPPVIEAAATWTFDGVEYAVPFTGRRVVVFPFRANWSSAVEETLEWRTVVDTSYTGKEQVTEIRSEPRRIMQYGFRIHGQDVNLFDNITFGWTARLFAAPLWHEKTKLTAAAALGATALSMPTEYLTFEAGSLALLFKDVANYEIIEIANPVTAGNATLARPTVRAWPAGTLVYPMIVAAPDANIPTVRQSDTHADGVIRFTVSPADNYVRLPTVAAPFTYRGEELYTGETNWVAPLGVDIGARQTLIDGDTGAFRLVRRAAYPLIQRGFRWLVGSKQDAELLRQFFGRRRGRLKPAWIPSGTRDFVLTENVTAAATTIYVTPNDYGTFVNAHPARRDIVVIMRNGTRIARRILSYGVDEFGRGALILDSALGVELTPASVKKISYLGLYRLASDSITFSWRTDQVAVVETNLVLKESP